MTELEKIEVIKRWLKDLSYLKLHDPKTIYYAGMRAVFDEMEARLAAWEAHVLKNDHLTK